MHKNRLEKIIWEEISKTLNDLGPDQFKTVISSRKLTENVININRYRKLYKIYKQRVKSYTTGGLMRRGERQYFEDFVFPTPGPKILPGEDIAKANSQSARAYRARARGDAPTTPDARAARSPEETIPMSNRRTARSRSAGTVDDYNAAWPTQPWGAAAVEKRIHQAGLSARKSTRTQFRSKGGVKKRDLDNADSVIDDAFDDALMELAKGGDNAAEKAVAAFKRRVGKGIDETNSATKTTNDIIEQLGKNPNARKDLKAGLSSQLKRTNARLDKIKKQVKDLDEEIKALDKKSKEISKKKKEKGISKDDKKRLQDEYKAVQTQKNDLAKRKGERVEAQKKTSSRKIKEEAEVSKIDVMNNKQAGEAWIKQNLQKGLDDIDDAVRQGADDFRLRRTAQTPSSPAPRSASRAVGRGGSRAEVDAARVIERTPKAVKDALGDTFEAVNKDPAMLSKALQWVRTQSGSTVQKLRDNPMAIVGLIVSGVSTGAILISIFSDSTDDEGRGHKAASVDEAREGIAAMEQEMNKGLQGLEDRVADSPEKSEPGEVSLDQQIQNFEPIFDQGAKSYLEKAKNYIMGNSEALRLINNFDPSAPVEKWSAEDGAIVLPKMVLYAIKASLVAAGAQMMVTGPNADTKFLKSALDEYIKIVFDEFNKRP